MDLYSFGITKPLSTNEEEPAPLRVVREEVRKHFDLAKRFRKPYEDRWKTFYGLHRNYERIAEAARNRDEPGRDIVEQAKREFGAELFIPYVYGLIETMTPRLLMNNPRLKVKPRTPSLAREQAEAVRYLFEERHKEIDYSLELIPIARSGLKYGLGVGKNYWDVVERNVATLEPTSVLDVVYTKLTGNKRVNRRVDRTEGPRTEHVDLPDFFWDPTAKDMRTCDWAIHRTWRSFEYIRERVEMRQWFPVNLEDVKSMSAPNDYGEQMRDRAEAARLEGYDSKAHGNMHEIWEYHDGERVVTILDGQIVVQIADAPINGDLPFSIFRPTLQENEFVGIGEIEPVVDLQRELNAVRSARLDNTMLIIQKAFFYAEGLVDPNDFILGPAKGIPVEGGSIDDVIRPINFGEIPSASYRETDEIKADFQMGSGLSDTVAGGEGSGPAAETATGIQFVQAAANVRVELKTKLLATELVKRDTRQYLELYRERTLLEPQRVMVERDGWYAEVEITGDALDLVRAVDPEEDSLAPENSAEKKNNALAFFNQVKGNEVVDQRVATRWFISEFDVPDPGSWILPEQTQMNPQVAQAVSESFLGTLRGAGIDEEAAQEIAASALESAAQVTGISAPENSQNGSVPEEAMQ